MLEVLTVPIITLMVLNSEFYQVLNLRWCLMERFRRMDWDRCLIIRLKMLSLIGSLPVRVLKVLLHLCRQHHYKTQRVPRHLLVWQISIPCFLEIHRTLTHTLFSFRISSRLSAQSGKTVLFLDTRPILTRGLLETTMKTGSPLFLTLWSLPVRNARTGPNVPSSAFSMDTVDIHAPTS